MSGRKAFIMGDGTIVENEYTKATIIGNGEIFGGSFDKLRVMGNCTITGNTSVSVLNAIGNIEATEPVTAGIARLTSHGCFKQLDAKHIIIRWGDKSTETNHLNGIINVELLEVLAKCSLEGSIKISNYLISGILTADEINCQNFICPGRVCANTINASNIQLYPSPSSSIKELCGTKIHVRKNFDKADINISGEYSWYKHQRRAAWKNETGRKPYIEIENVEADDIYLENTKALHVSGKNVTIGSGCHIDHIEYMQSVNMAPDAATVKVEKI